MSYNYICEFISSHGTKIKIKIKIYQKMENSAEKSREKY